MKRNLAFLLMMTAATLAQTPTVVEKPAAKPSAATVKAVPQVKAVAAKPAVVAVKPAPVAVKVSAAPAAKPAVSVQTSNAKTAPTAAAKPAGITPTKPVPAAATSKSSPFAAAAATTKTAANTAKPAGNSTKVAAAPRKVTTAQQPTKGTKTKTPAKEAGTHAADAKTDSKSQTTVAVQVPKPAEADKKPAAKTINAVGRRDPFISPVVNLGAVGSGCSSGKRCLAIDQIALKGVVKSETGMIAVVVNAMDKAYFLRENDPVFNGYVVKITGDSIIFKETFHDKLGKPLTRDVTKSITRPAV
jgi:Tfp pilus assembly protein PilP